MHNLNKRLYLYSDLEFLKYMRYHYLNRLPLIKYLMNYQLKKFQAASLLLSYRFFLDKKKHYQAEHLLKNLNGKAI